MDNYKITENWDTFEDYRTEKSRGITTGYKSIDSLIIGLPSLVTIMGEPKCYKSTFTLGILIEKAIEGYPVILIDKENGLQRTRLRIISYLSGLTLGIIKSDMSQQEMDKYTKGLKHLEDLPIFYISENCDIKFIEDLIKNIGNRYKKHILLIVDSLQSLVADFKDRRASIDFWIFAFNDLKLKYNGWLTILLVSEKNRQAYGMASKSGAKESGGIEYKTEMTLDLYPSNDEGIIVECMFNRDGDTGIVARLHKPNPYCYKLEAHEYIPE